MALLHVLRELDAAAELHLVAVAHLNHQLRAAAADDERFAAGVAARLGLPFSCERVDVRQLAASGRRSLEDAAHAARYAFFEQVIVRHQADVVAVGHTRDDQAETFLLRLIRGAGARGLSAMHPRSGVVIRPLLDCSKADVRAFLEAHDISVIHDASNDDVGIPRNRVRAELVPLLAARFNPQVVEALATAAELARADEQYLGAVAAQWCADHVTSAEGRWQLDALALASLPAAVGRRVLHAAMSRAACGRLVGFKDVARAWSVVVGEAPGFDAPGHRVERNGGFVVLTRGRARSAGRHTSGSGSPTPAFSYRLPVPGDVVIPEVGCRVSAELSASASDAQQQVNARTAVVALAKVGRGLMVRNRRNGDKLRPSAVGSRKLQDLLVDRKVPRSERDRIPIVTDADGRIVWVAGHATDLDFRVSDPAQAVVILRLKGVGGSF